MCKTFKSTSGIRITRKIMSKTVNTVKKVNILKHRACTKKVIAFFF